MPTLFRFVTILAVIAALIYAAMFALANFVTPRQTEMVVPVHVEQIDSGTVATPRP